MDVAGFINHLGRLGIAAIRLTDAETMIGLARQQGLIPSARAVFATLHASGFRVTPEVIQAV